MTLWVHDADARQAILAAFTAPVAFSIHNAIRVKKTTQQTVARGAAGRAVWLDQWRLPRPGDRRRYVARRIVFVGVRLLTRDSMKFPTINSFASNIYLWGTCRFEIDDEA